MKKPSVYLDTSIISAYWYEGTDVGMQVRRMRTREWWDLERRHFEIWASDFTESELQEGVFRRQSECLKMVRRLRYLPATREVYILIEDIMRLGLVPANKRGDAAHLATSAMRNIDYLLTWNYTHMANPITQARLEKLCEQMQVVAPWMVSPEQIPQVRFGKSIWRADKHG